MNRQSLFACVSMLCLLAACQRPDGEAASPSPAATPVPAASPTSKPSKPPVASAAAAPALKVRTLDGGLYDLAGHRGKWVVVNFWATWCSPCLKEMPELSALDAMREHIEVIGLAYEEIEPEAMRAFLEKHPVVYPVAILDVYDPPKDFATPRGLPMTYLLAPDGQVARQFLGPVTAKEIESAIADAAAAAPPPAG